MTGFRLALTLTFVIMFSHPVWAVPTFFDGPFVDIDRLNRCLKGRVDDYTNNHGKDRRFCSKALGELRDVYVYVPPGFNPEKRYPLVYWLHGLAQDEKTFLEIVEVYDRLINKGVLPHCVIVAPDNSAYGRASYFDPGTLGLNSPLGKFEDYLVTDVWNHVVTRYPIRPEREAHVLAGASMGGFAAYNLAIKHREQFGVCIGIMPPLNIRYEDRFGKLRGDFDPQFFRFAEQYKPREPLASFAGGLIKVRERRVIAPVFGEDADTIKRISAENPAEMLFTRNVKPGELEMFAGVGTDDDFNFDASVASYVYLAKQRGIAVTHYEVKGGKHNRETAYKMLDPFADWIRPRLEKYAPKD